MQQKRKVDVPPLLPPVIYVVANAEHVQQSPKTWRGTSGCHSSILSSVYDYFGGIALSVQVEEIYDAVIPRCERTA